MNNVSVYFFQCSDNTRRTICDTSFDASIAHFVPQKAKILDDIFLLLRIPYTEPNDFVLLVFVVDEKQKSSGEMISIDHEIVHILIDQIDTVNSIRIESALYILSDDILILARLIRELAYGVSFGDICVEYGGCT